MTPTVLAQDTMSYEEYFSETREWSYDYSGMVTEDLAWTTYKGSHSDFYFGYPQEGTYLLNRLYLKNVSTKEFTLLLDEDVDSVALVNGKLICIIDGNKIAQVDLSGNITYTYYEAAEGEKLSNIYGNSELIFFRKNDTICRIHVASGRLDELLTQPGIIRFEPKSSEEVYWTVYTPEWLAIHGNHICGEGCDSNDISVLSTYQYNVFSQETVEAILSDFSEEDTQVVYAGTGDIIFGKTTPIPQYPHGSYFMTTGRACSNHNSCITYAGASQCKGFARYVSNYSLGTTVCENQAKQLVFSTQAELIETIQASSVGSHIRYLKKIGNLSLYNKAERGFNRH